MCLQLANSKQFLFLLNLGILNFLYFGNSCLICQKSGKTNHLTKMFLFSFCFYWPVCLTGGLVYLPRVVIRTSYQTDTTKQQTSNMLFVASKKQSRKKSLNGRYQCVCEKKVQKKNKEKEMKTHTYTYTLMGNSKT